jgi:hypothetical protein
MNNLSKTSKSLLVVVFISYAVWIGTYIAKNLCFFQFFDPETMALRNIFEKSDNFSVFYSFFPVITTNIICYGLFVIAFLLFVFTSKISLRYNGWLFISLLIVLITLPVEVYLIFKFDLKIVLDTNSMSLVAKDAIEMLKQRVSKFGMFSFISMFSTLSIVFFFIFRPLTKNEN